MVRFFTIILFSILQTQALIAISTDSILIDSSNRSNIKGTEYYLAGDYLKAKEYWNLCLKIDKSIKSSSLNRIARSNNNLGVLYLSKWEYDSAIYLFDEARKIFSLSKNQESDLAIVYSNIGNIYRFKGDYLLAEQYYKVALEKLRTIKPTEETIQRLAATYNRFGILELNKKEYKSSLYYFKKAITQNKEKISPSTLHDLYINISECYMYNFQPDSAIFFYKKALYLARTNKSLPNRYLATSLRYIAGYYIETNNFKEALKYLKESERVMQSMQIDKTFYIDLNNLYSQYYEKTGDFNQAIQWYQKSLSILSRVNVENTLSTPEAENYNNIIGSITLLKNKSACFNNWYKKKNDIGLLKKSLESATIAAKLIDMARNSYLTIESKLLLAENETPIYQSGIFCAYELYYLTKENTYLEQAFLLAEKSKSSVLSSVLQEEKAKTLGIIPADFLGDFERLSREITFYKENIYEEQYKYNPDSQKLKLWNNYLFQYSQELEKLKQLLEKQYPEYYRLKYKQLAPSISAIQHIIDNKTSIIEYVYADTIIYVFHITKNKCILTRSKITEEFKENTHSYLAFFRQFNYLAQNKESYQLYQNLAFELYNSLIDPVGEENIRKKLIIIPDDILSYIPFEALVNKKSAYPIQSYGDINYMILSHSISYSYSSALLIESWSGTSRSFYNSLLAIAPSYSPNPNQQNLKHRGSSTRNYRDNLQPLPFAMEEAKQISQLTHGSFLTGNYASEDAFIKIAGEYDILHLAMHTLIDDVDPLFSKLVFYSSSYENDKGLLTTNEIFGLKLKARMTVLSSCSSGEGEYKNGEGVISLARGFFYAGCPSLIMTLWNVDDESGLLLMRDFYKFLLNGYSKAEAMQLAKIKYLKTAPSEKQNPFYWSTYIVIGNPTPIYYARWIVLTTSFILSGTVFYILFVLIRKRKRTIPLKDPYL